MSNNKEALLARREKVDERIALYEEAGADPIHLLAQRQVINDQIERIVAREQGAECTPTTN